MHEYMWSQLYPCCCASFTAPLGKYKAQLVYVYVHRSTHSCTYAVQIKKVGFIAAAEHGNEALGVEMNVLKT